MHWSKKISYRLLHPLWIEDAKRKVALLSPLIEPGSRVLEIGSGPGTVLQELIQSGCNATALDLENLIIVPGLPDPVLYDGTTIPFENNAFDVSTLFCVLHHCSDPVRVFREAGRVGKTIAIVEDVFRNQAQRRLTQVTDSLVNAEFIGHPQQQKSEAQWLELFADEGWVVRYTSSWRLFGLYRQVFYFLEPA